MTNQRLDENTILGELIPMRKQTNKTANYEFTIIAPVFNEEDNVYALEKKLSAFLSQSALSACILFVNDCSSDQSQDRIIEVCNRQKHFYYLSLTKNSGLSAALKTGIDATWSTYVGYIDVDLQPMPKDFNMLISYIGEYELVMGIRVKHHDSLVKKASSKIANGFRRFITHDGVSD